jgi:hypothetical protein
MVAHGTIAFDTLTTSDQVKTGTEKSLDTSYIFNGVAKAWTSDETLASDTAGVWTGDTFNVSSVTHSTTGQCLVNFSNNFNNTGFASHGTQSGVSVNDIVSTKENNTTTARDDVYIYDGSYRDAPFCHTAFGDLA